MKAFVLHETEEYCIPINPNNGLYMTHEEVQEYIDCLNNYINKTSNEAIKEHNIQREIEIKKSEEEALAKLKMRKTENKIGYVYFIKTSSGAYKIGQTINLKSRIQSFKALDENVVLIHSIKVKNPLKVEKLFHEYYKDKHLYLELFKLSETDIKLIKQLSLPVKILNELRR